MPNGTPREWDDGDLSVPRWQGRMEARYASLHEWVGDIAKSVEQLEKDLTALRVMVAQIRTQVGVWSAIGGVIGAGVVTGIALVIGH